MHLFIWLSFALCPLLATAVPSPPVQRRDISGSLLDEFTLFSQYSAAANCRANHNGSTPQCGADVQLPVYCDPGKCPDLKVADTVIGKASFLTYKQTKCSLKPGDTHGYLALDHTNELIVLSFRGTESFSNSMADVWAFQVDATGFQACDGCRAHRGFWDAYQAASECLMPQVKVLSTLYPAYRIAVTGHSLGGALATLGAAKLRNEGYIVDLYSFGSPSVGNYAFSKFISDQVSGTNYRLAHAADAVPSILFRGHALQHFFGEYSQLAPEYWITSGNGVPVTTGDIQVLQGINNTDGNLGLKGTLGDHKWYIGNTTVCEET